MVPFEFALASPAWGKLGEDGESQNLVDHCRDVAAVFLALCRLPGIRSRLCRLAGTDAFPEVWLDRLGWFVFLHDLGKVNAGFQKRRFPGTPMVGHVSPIAGAYEFVCGGIDVNRLGQWAAPDSLSDWFNAVLSHHGKPWTDAPRDLGRHVDLRHWQPAGNYKPAHELLRLRHVADARFRQAFSDAPSIPFTAPLIHALAGLTMLADWIASSDWRNSPPPERLEQWAGEWLERIGLDPAPWRARLATEADFRSAFGFPPNPAQAAFAAAAGPLAILESETGSGKTEAALWRFVERFRVGAVDGLYFALPTRTAAAALHRRVEKLAAALWPREPPPVVLAVPGYLEDTADGALPLAHDGLDQIEDDARDRPVWAGEHPKRYFAGMIAVGTIDQALLSVLKAKHAHMRGAALMRLMLVVDEVHASDAYMGALTEELLADHIAAGGEAALLSATLGTRARLRYASIGMAPDGNLRAAEDVRPSLAEAIAFPYPAITTNSRLGGALAGIAATGRQKQIAIELTGLIDDADAIAERAAAIAVQDAKVLVVRNTVTSAIAVQEALERLLGVDSPLLFRVEGVATLHHGRFAREDRLLLDASVEAAVGKAHPAGGLVLVGTQTLEQSLDIDADYLISDLCPVDVLLQRLGRLHRHAREPDGVTDRLRPEAFRQPRVLVLAPPDDLAGLLIDRRRGRDSHGLGPMIRQGVVRGIYPDVITLELTRRLCAERPMWTIPAMNRELVERVLHPEAREAFFAALPKQEQAFWQNHDNDIVGTSHADGTTARQSVLDRDKDFMHLDNFIPSDEHFTTRLGETGRILDLPEGTIGPFTKEIRRLAIPSWWQTGVEEPSFLRVENNQIQFELGGTRVAYGRHGLLRMAT